MPVTLAQAQLNVQDDIQRGVIDEFRKSSFLLDSMTFDDAVSPGTSGATLTYGYTRLITESTAAFRALNSEYTAQEATKDRFTTELKVFGGAFEIDRVIANMDALVSEVQLQSQQKIKAARSLFHDTTINGDSAVNANAFDGLDKAITGSDTEYFPNNDATTYIDLSTTSAMDSNWKEFLDQLELALSNLDEKPAAIMGNSKSITKIKQVARRAGYKTASEDAFGRKVDEFDGIPLIDLGLKPNASNGPIVDIYTGDLQNDGTTTADITGLTDLYFARFGLDAFHGVSMANAPLVRMWLPDFNTAGAVKKGEVEMVSSIALKRTKAAGVLRQIKVQ
jgi:hypothetical protein